MLKSHIDAKENALLAISKVPANSGHPLHKGTPREAFIKEFLESHLPEVVAIGTGEIIDCKSKPNQTRNQFDIVIYKRSYPKLNFGGGISGFLVESVVATIEVKSTLTESDLDQAIKAASSAKSLEKNVVSSFSTGYSPPAVLNYVVAYNGPAKIHTVHNWIAKLHTKEGITTPTLETDTDKRIKQSSPSIDGVFVLGKGFLCFDNVPMGFASDEVRKRNPDIKWVMTDTPTGNLLMLFLLLQQATSNIQGQWLNAGPYLSTFSLLDIRFGTS